MGKGRRAVPRPQRLIEAVCHIPTASVGTGKAMLFIPNSLDQLFELIEPDIVDGRCHL